MGKLSELDSCTISKRKLASDRTGRSCVELVPFFIDPFVWTSQVLNMCEADDTALLKLPCYKSISNLVPLRKSALSEFLLFNCCI